MSPRLLTALKCLLATVVVIVLAWLAVCAIAMVTGHLDALPGIGAVLVDLIDKLITQPLHELAGRLIAVAPAGSYARTFAAPRTAGTREGQEGMAHRREGAE